MATIMAARHVWFVGDQTHVKCLQFLRKCERLRNRSDINSSCGLGASSHMEDAISLNAVRLARQLSP